MYILILEETYLDFVTNFEDETEVITTLKETNLVASNSKDKLNDLIIELTKLTKEFQTKLIEIKNSNLKNKAKSILIKQLFENNYFQKLNEYKIYDIIDNDILKLVIKEIKVIQSITPTASIRMQQAIYCL